MLVGPAHSRSGVTLTAARDPGRASHRPAHVGDDPAVGFVQIQDIAPTILNCARRAVPTVDGGQPGRERPTGGRRADRLEFLATPTRPPQFRDDRSR
jgi:hypothetical protein